MRITYRDEFTTIEATAEEIRSGQGLAKNFKRVLNSIFSGVAQEEEPEEEEPAEEDEEE